MHRNRGITPVTLALWALLAVSPARAQTAGDSVKHSAIRQLLAVQRTDSLVLEGVEQAFASDSEDPNLPAGYMDSLRVRIRRDISVFLERLAPVYDSLYTLDEIRQLTAFYRSPVGQRYLATQGTLTEAIGEVARQWGMELAGQLLVEMSRQPPPRTPRP